MKTLLAAAAVAIGFGLAAITAPTAEAGVASAARPLAALSDPAPVEAVHYRRHRRHGPVFYYGYGPRWYGYGHYYRPRYHYAPRYYGYHHRPYYRGYAHYPRYYRW